MLRGDVSPSRVLPIYHQAEALQLVTLDGVRREDPVYDPGGARRHDFARLRAESP